VSEIGILQVLKHDLHKVRTPDYTSHKDALPDPLQKEADKVASRLSRNWEKREFEVKSFRWSLIKPNLGTTGRDRARDLRQEVTDLFKETDPVTLHEKILQSEVLNHYVEAREFPFTSLKYHLVLAGALYYNLKKGGKWHRLYLCENAPVESEFQVIYKDDRREWSLQVNSGFGLARVRLKFYETWDTRIESSIGGVNRVFDQLLSRIGSWSAALATIDDSRTE
jgi:hypothetical protein